MTTQDQITLTEQISRQLPTFIDTNLDNWSGDVASIRLANLAVTDIGWTIDGITRDGDHTTRITVIGAFQDEDEDGLFDAYTELTALEGGATFATGGFEYKYRAAAELRGIAVERSANLEDLPEHVTDPLAREILASLIAAVRVHANL